VPARVPGVVVADVARIPAEDDIAEAEAVLGSGKEFFLTKVFAAEDAVDVEAVDDVPETQDASDSKHGSRPTQSHDLPEIGKVMQCITGVRDIGGWTGLVIRQETGGDDLVPSTPRQLLLYRDLGVKSLEELKSLAEGGGLASVAGLGEKTIERITKSLERLLQGPRATE
jgi:hypothetical protein